MAGHQGVYARLRQAMPGHDEAGGLMRRLPITLALLAALATPALAQRGSCHRGATFEQWLDQFKRDAMAQGISARTIAAASHHMVYDQSVVNKDRGQKVF